MQNNGQARSYPFSYAISSADTWEKKSITIAGDTSGTWLTTNGRGIQLNFSLGTGATFSGSAGSWAGANYLGTTSTVSVVGTNAATWYVTGVQLEKGSTATEFEHRSYGEELALCHTYAIDIAGKSLYGPCGTGFSNSTTIAFIFIPLQFSMRATPSLDSSTSAASLFQLEKAGSLINLTAIALAGSATASSKGVYLQCSVASGLTANDFRVLRNNNSATSKIILSAEL